mmetsp:Transcript_4899/g.14772  ORF Transcript_4899/g.14772 Transcript_4899/m.14772 type:complete len:361 (+) Transcript_4899:156-1238(+)|eukprot:CAMPEP_0198723106 /NCGR_PEP_ID=MMETSP1475-20131203/664_1 /TAXON_ID= ORGANISM="Unidentified sp., Strain CCMP1999" /NCGR_SAMPLE_ID=MMETSP1475 /ASSEMBLY_ACC=CAM_ASM_001111 /LENGTH=360 /DNA_ID=CAMNT_0044484115 /DNA_START=144 /DNA_END=1226 /DNA_ORIENTATION=-
MTCTGFVSVGVLPGCPPRRLAVQSAHEDRPRDRGSRGQDPRTTQHIHDFLTQRSLQTLLFYFDSCRDTTSYKYLEGFLGHEGLYGYHGLYGLRVPWRDYFKELVKAPNETIIIRNPNYRRGGSKDNPYLPPRHRDFEMTVEPRQLAKRLLEVRAHVAEEMTSDIALLKDENDELRRHHREMVRNQEDREIIFRMPAREVESVYHANSPFRGGTYDLLKRFSIYVGVKRVIEKLDREYTTRDAHKWLAKFMEEKGTKFLGDNGYNVGELFIEELWAQAPLVRRGRNGAVKVIDPDALVKTILHERLAVANEWIISLMSVPRDHMELQRAVLTNLIQDPTVKHRPDEDAARDVSKDAKEERQ